MPSSASRLLLVATVALLIVGTTMATQDRHQTKTRLRLQRERLLVESTCATGATADGSSCTSGADCASGFCRAYNPDDRRCSATCAQDGQAVVLGDGACSCCSGVDDGSDTGYGDVTCISR